MAEISKQADTHVEQIVSKTSNEYTNEKQDASDRHQARELRANWVEGSAAEKALVRKLDWRILVSLHRSKGSLTNSGSHAPGSYTC